ncbi:MAG TPA: MBL fold metallo-hydrolase [Verrucomicrobiota bacterium]|nr:hypothetical protein [Verrucomicrobiales bacterium]HRI16703.1 MBL fold metallo-hydrolase [Verrucomicrobiota bacterium]
MTSPPPTSAEHQLNCLGVGEGWPSGSRRPASFLYRLGETRLLVDCGDGMSSAFKATGWDYESLDAVLLSHMHSDHVGGFSMFVQSLWLNRRRRSLPVYAPARALPALQAWLEATLLPPGLIGFELQWRPLVSHEPFTVGGVTVVAHQGTHLDSLRRSFEAQHPNTAFDSYSFVISDSRRSVAHTADVGGVIDLQPLLAARPNLFVSELSHVEIEAITDAIHKTPPGRVVFVHIARDYLLDVPRLEQRLREQLGDIPFSLARDDDAIAF